MNDAQWASEEAFRAMLANPECREHMAATRAISTAVPRLYTVASVHHA